MGLQDLQAIQGVDQDFQESLTLLGRQETLGPQDPQGTQETLQVALGPRDLQDHQVTLGIPVTKNKRDQRKILIHQGLLIPDRLGLQAVPHIL